MRSSSAGHCVAALDFAASGEVRYFLARKSCVVLLNFCPAAGYLALKTYHDLQICTRPTCLGIPGDGIRKNTKFKSEAFFFEFTNFKIEMHENVPRLDISLTKKSHDLQICTRPTCRCILSDGIRKKKIKTGSDKLLNSAFFLEKYKWSL